MAEIKTRLRELRLEKGESQEETARLLSVSRTSYCKYELGTHEISVESLLLLANHYGVSIDYIVGRTNMPYCLENISEDELSVLRKYRQCSKKDIILRLMSETERPENLSSDERELIQNYRAANRNGKCSIIDYSDFIVKYHCK